VSRKEVLDAFKRVVLLVEKKSKRILFKLSKNSLAIISDDNETGTAEENIECKYDGEETTIAFNYGYIEEPFKIMSEDEVVFYFSDVTKALTVKPIPESYFFHVLMPMQI
jgi:DNA polymerase-3 subunit beta